MATTPRRGFVGQNLTHSAEIPAAPELLKLPGMKASPTAGSIHPDAEAPARMSRAQFWSVLAFAFTLFLFQAGPIWRHPWNMELLNRAIFWSYVAIPLLVIACLAWSRHLSPRAFIVDTLVLVLVKYTCTFAFALVLWEMTPFPPSVHAAARSTGTPTTAVEPTPAVTPLDPARTGSVTGKVIDAAGHPIPGALVWIDGGLEDFVFAPPSVPVAIDRADIDVVPPLAVVQVNQPVLARSTDGKLHTLVAVRDGKTLFNAPLLASGEPRHLSFREAEGLVTLHCNVHPGTSEAEAQILVLGHPFFTKTHEDGRFELRGVPTGRVRLVADVGSRPGPEQTVDIRAGEDMNVTLRPDAATALGVASPLISRQQ